MLQLLSWFDPICFVSVFTSDFVQQLFDISQQTISETKQNYLSTFI